MPEQSRTALKADAIAAIAAIAATAARFPLLTIVDDRIPFATYYVALLVVALTGSGRAVLVCSALSSLACVYFFLSPDRSLLITGDGDLARLALFVLTSVWSRYSRPASS
jgi:K+-sensing histidine kinase KdpD